MVETRSTLLLPLGAAAPGFSLPDPRGEMVSSDDLAGSQALLVMFICNHCPFVKHIRHELARIGQEYQDRGVAIVAINSNDIQAYPADAPEKMIEEIDSAGYTFPYLLDESQEVAKAYGAACTPDFFLFDGERKLVYRGQMDDSRPGSDIPVTGKDLRDAMDGVLSGRPAPSDPKPSIGCNIKWKPGNEPPYFGAR
jgi:peroxiredoxin